MFGLFGPSKKDILEEGRQAMATIRDVSETGMRVNGRPRVALTLEVAPMGEATFTVEKKLLLPDDLSPQVGQQVPVRFLPEDLDKVEIDRGALEMTQAQIVTSSGGTVPAAPPPPPPPPVPDPSAAPATDLSSLIEQAQASGHVTWSGDAQAIDARDVPGLRAQMVETLKQYGIEVPDVPAPGAPASAPAPPAEEDSMQKLEKLSALHRQGVLTDAEFQSAKAKVLGEL